VTKPIEYRRNSHCVYLCDYHIVYPTKYRRAIITTELWKYLYGKLLEITTSRGIKEKFPELKKYYWGTDGIWSDGYFVSTVGITTEIIRRYIENQGELDAGQRAKLFD